MGEGFEPDWKKKLELLLTSKHFQVNKIVFALIKHEGH